MVGIRLKVVPMKALGMLYLCYPVIILFQMIRVKEILSNSALIKKRILNSGLLSLHSFKINRIQSKKKFFYNNKLDLNKRLIISIIHPETWDSNSFKKKIVNYFKIFNKLNHNLILIYPCGDPGYKLIIDEIKKLEKKSNIKIFKNIKSDKFYNFLYYSDILIGNSSSGILEAGYFNTKVINVGNRQKNRYSKNVINVGFNYTKILEKINHLLTSNKISQKKFNNKHIYFNKNGLNNVEKFIKNILNKKNHNQILKLF